MKFSIERAHFKNGLALVSNLVGSAKNPSVQLNNVCIEAVGDSVSLTTSNLDITIRARVRAEVVAGGTISLPVKLLQSIVSLEGDRKIEIEVNSNSRATITSGNARFNINGLSADGFPVLNTLVSEHEFEVPAADVLAILGKVAHAQSTDDGRYILQGVFFDFGLGNLSVAATDGRRLATASKPVAGIEEHSGKFVLSSRAVAELRHVLKDAGAGNVRISFNDRNVTFVAALSPEATQETGLVENVHLHAKLVEGTYPNYKQVIPKEIIYRLELEREVLLKAIHTASVVLRAEKSKTLRFDIEPDQIHITAECADTGDGSSTIGVKFEGESMRISFNPDFLTAPLENISDDNIVFEFNDALSPGVFKASDDFLCVVMPQRSTN